MIFHRRNLSGFDPATEVAMLSVLYVQSTFQATSRSTTVGRPPHSALDLRREDTTSSASHKGTSSSSPGTISVSSQHVR
jgi:hypothetical protein